MRALTADPSVSLVDEPDNEGQTVSAIWAKRRLGRYPVLMDDVEDERYRHLWDWATRGAPSTRRLVAAGWLLNSVPHAARARYYQGRYVDFGLPLQDAIAAPSSRSAAAIRCATSSQRRTCV